MERIYSTDFGRRSVGFKIFEGENDAMLDTIMERLDIRKVVLFRRNVLASYSSALLAKKTGQYGVSSDGRPPATEPQKVKFNHEKFVKYHDRYVTFVGKAIERLQLANQEYCFVNYEDMNEPHVLANVAAFVGGESSKAFCTDLQYKKQLKQNPPDILSRFSNPRAAANFLREHDLSGWAYEGALDMGRRLGPSAA